MCPECGKEVSNQAKTCPHCGFRLQATNQWEAILGTIKEKKKLIIGLGIVFLVVIAVVAMSSNTLNSY